MFFRGCEGPKPDLKRRRDAAVGGCAAPPRDAAVGGCAAGEAPIPASAGGFVAFFACFFLIYDKSAEKRKFDGKQKFTFPGFTTNLEKAVILS